MAKNTKIDRITVAFYEELKSDIVILEFLNQKVPGRMRGTKAKEIIYEYLKEHEPEFVQDTLDRLKSDGIILHDNSKIENDTQEELQIIEEAKPQRGNRKILPALQSIMATSN